MCTYSCNRLCEKLDYYSYDHAIVQLIVRRIRNMIVHMRILFIVCVLDCMNSCTSDCLYEHPRSDPSSLENAIHPTSFIQINPFWTKYSMQESPSSIYLVICGQQLWDYLQLDKFSCSFVAPQYKMLKALLLVSPKSYMITAKPFRKSGKAVPQGNPLAKTVTLKVLEVSLGAFTLHLG